MAPCLGDQLVANPTPDEQVNMEPTVLAAFLDDRGHGDPFAQSSKEPPTEPLNVPPNSVTR
jgi:hypothetical protein